MIVLLCPAADKSVPLRAEKTEGELRTKQAFFPVLLPSLEYAYTVIKFFFLLSESSACIEFIYLISV